MPVKQQKKTQPIRMATLFLGKQRFDFPVLESTNATAIELLSKSKPTEGTLLVTPHQTAGKGQIGSSWQSEAGKNLTFSLILYPVFLPVRAQFDLSIAVSMALHDALTELLPAARCRVKWPNDLFLENKKVAGVLIQNSLLGSTIQYAVVGIGLNVNQQHFGDELPHAGSLASVAGKAFSTEAVLEELLLRLEQRYLQLRAGKSAALRNTYSQYLFGINELRSFYLPGEGPLEGRIRGVDPSGKLLVETEQGMRSFNLKEIAQRMP